MKLTWPAPERNKGPILDVLTEVLGASGTLLEIASGTGQHAAFFAEKLPNWRFLPSDPAHENRASISAYREESGLSNLEAPLSLDVREPGWRVPKVDAVLCANMIHIAPFECAEALLRGASACLTSGGVLLLYGPFRFSGEFTSESNAAFDHDLQLRDASWGVRDVDDILPRALAQGLVHEQTLAMPANNHMLVFRRAQR